MFQLSRQNGSFFCRVQEKPIWCHDDYWCARIWLGCFQKQPFSYNNELLLCHLEPEEYFPPRRFLMSLCERSLLFAASDANWGSGGGREGHLRAAVVVQLARACAAYHSSVRVRSSVRVSVPEAPDVALWADRWSRVESGILNVHSNCDR